MVDGQDRLSSGADAVIARAPHARVLVSRPDASNPSQSSVGVLATLLRAKQEGTAACILQDRDASSHPLLALTTSDVRVVTDTGTAGAWLRATWNMAAAAHRARERASDASASFWHEFYREIRQHAGNERFPPAFRSRLRDAAHRSLARATAAGRLAAPFPRRLLRNRVRTELPAMLHEQAARQAVSSGIPQDAPIVAVEVRGRGDTVSDAIRFLQREGYVVVRVGDVASGPLALPGVIEAALTAGRSWLLEIFVLLKARFVVCGSTGLQHVAYLTNTPALTLNAKDPFSAYPVREDGLYTLSSVVDLDTGRTLTTSDLLSGAFFRNMRNCGWRDNTAREIVDAVREMHEGVARGWTESESQVQFRSRVVAAGTALADSVPYVGQWGPDEGFVGDGRLARVQADEGQ